MIRIVTERENGTLRVAMKCEGPSLTEQAHKDMCDINKIVGRAVKSGFLKQRYEPAMYGDFSGVDDFHAAQNKILQAEADFMRIPAVIRKRFDNDPGKLLDFVHNPENALECVEMGLLERDVVSVPEPVVADSGGTEEPSGGSEPE